MKNVSCEYNRWVVETQLCKLCDTSDTLIGRAFVLLCVPFICNIIVIIVTIIIMVFVNYIYGMVVDTQFHKFYGKSFARVLYLFLKKDVGR